MKIHVVRWVSKIVYRPLQFETVGNAKCKTIKVKFNYHICLRLDSPLHRDLWPLKVKTKAFKLFLNFVLLGVSENFFYYLCSQTFKKNIYVFFRTVMSLLVPKIVRPFYGYSSLNYIPMFIFYLHDRISLLPRHVWFCFGHFPVQQLCRG